MTTSLSPQLRARYGLDHRPWLTWLLAGLLVVGFVVALGWVGYTTSRPQVNGALLTWTRVAPDRADVTFEVRRGERQAAFCAIRAQDPDRADVGYAVVEVPPGSTYQQVTYRLRTITPAYVVEVLGCADDGAPDRVPPPQFPPGVAPPAQPWTE